jgi:redox-sensitive bicupin YhaK (pirin superfamily)
LYIIVSKRFSVGYLTIFYKKPLSMQKITPVAIVSQGKRADIGSYKIDRMLPNRYIEAVGPFVFLDHLLPFFDNKEDTAKIAEGTGAHPHRGIATLTYVLRGEAEHYDSKGHYAKVHSGGVQWMKAGNGIVHDESLHADSLTDDPIINSFQFWINLPAKNKSEDAAYLSIEADDVPTRLLTDDSGWLKVIAGDYEQLRSKVPSYSKQFLYHLYLEPGKYFEFQTEETTEYAAFLPSHSIVINDTEYQNGDFLLFSKSNGKIEVKNVSTLPVDLLLFGGEPYTEPIVAAGPFVMNTQHEISLAYNDYYKGKYGTIKYKA